MRALFLVSSLALLAGCPTNLGAVDAGVVDAGPVVITCSASFGEPGSECPQDVPECSAGICKRPCAANEGCNDLATFCNAGTGYCEPGCRDSSVCPAGTACSAGQCIQAQGCATKCDCQVGQICANGSCTEPPATCASNADCGRGSGDDCEDIVCSGFAPRTCFDPDPEPCNADTDCNGRPGCAAGCTCTGNQQCVPEVACTEANEATTCGAGNYCDLNGACQPAPVCTSEAQCTPFGLTCNTGLQQCVRAAPCTTSAECTTEPTTFCNTNTGFCVQPLCNNGGVTCDAGEQCAADGACRPQGQGGPCTVDANCTNPADYCAVVAGTGQCTPGCRNNASCGAGQTCNGARQCVGGGGGDLAGYDEDCGDDADCQTGLVCGAFTNRCQEQCQPADSPCAGGACCTLSGEQCCNFIGFCSGSGC